MTDKLIASEALYGFAGWLTSSDTHITASSRHDAAIWAEKVVEFCRENKLAEPRPGWDKNLIHPSGECSGSAPPTKERISMDLTERYKGLAPGLRIGADESTCADCRHIEMDNALSMEVDYCKKHTGMYHDWNTPEEENFADSLRCDDWEANDGS